MQKELKGIRVAEMRNSGKHTHELAHIKKWTKLNANDDLGSQLRVERMC